MNRKTDKPQKTQTRRGLREYPGVAQNEADSNRVNEKLTDERTKMLNNNPRNTDDRMP